jgi:MFS family permease
LLRHDGRFTRRDFFAGHRRALSSPAWQAITPLLVPRQDLDSAISANSVGYSLSRAVGPALGGIVIAALGISVPFWIFWASNVGIVAALLWWRSPRKGAEGLPAERLSSAVRMGIRYAANNRYVGRH